MFLFVVEVNVHKGSAQAKQACWAVPGSQHQDAVNYSRKKKGKIQCRLFLIKYCVDTVRKKPLLQG